MKQILFALALLLTSPAMASNAPYIAENTETTLKADKIYFFAHSLCQSCRHTYIYFETQHKDLNIPITDMKTPHNLELYKQCVKKFNIPNNELTLPLICMGDKYIMGWNPNTSPAQFEQALKTYKGH